jgi:predicted methyltransferase
MTLLDKLNDKIITNINIVESENRMYYEYNHLELAEKCEKIADDYAIEFAKWYDKSNYRIEVYKTLKTYEQVLEIFKKDNYDV